MKRSLFVFTACLFIVASTLTYAQTSRIRMGNYDPKTEVTLNGTVEKVEYTNYGNMRGVHLTLKAENGTLEVHLGPAAFVEKTMTFKGGDNIQVIGSKLTMVGKPAVIAREVTKGDKVLKLRDETGVPLWSGGHRRGRRIS